MGNIQNHSPLSLEATRPSQRGTRHTTSAAAAFATSLIIVTLLLLRPAPPAARPGARANNGAPSGLAALLDASVQLNDRYDIGKMNLICAEGLPDAAGFSVGGSLATLDTMADRVRHETERHLYRFQRNPSEFENSPGFFRMLMLAVVLAEDFGITYDDQRKAGPADSRANDRFFADPDAVFLTGLLGPHHRGTCSSMPVLYVAVGRRLGYPLKLASTKGHLFVRWDGAGERFNIEATGHGINRLDDDYYRHWPFEITAAEEGAEGYLKSFTPAQELAAFLSIRGMCLREAGRLSEAAEAFSTASRLNPNCPGYARMRDILRSQLASQPSPHATENHSSRNAAEKL